MRVTFGAGYGTASYIVVRTLGLHVRNTAFLRGRLFLLPRELSFQRMDDFEDRGIASGPGPMRLLLRVGLTLLFAIPACLALVIVFAFEARRGMTPSP
jgi:hypothetical protein